MVVEVAHGIFKRDVQLYKTLALCHLAHRIYPLVSLPRDVPCLLGAAMGFGITILATHRLGIDRTYFGSELGFVKPRWVNKFPYGYIYHPMIVGQLVAFCILLFWYNYYTCYDGIIMDHGTSMLLIAHMAC